MFNIFDLAEIGACFAAFMTVLFVLVRRPRNLSAHFFTAAALSSGLMWTAFILIVPRDLDISNVEHGTLTCLLSLATGMWLMFLLMFAREPAANLFRRRSLTVYAALGLLILASIGAFFNEYFVLDQYESGEIFFAITGLGRVYLSLIIIANAFGLLQLESTFRAAQGRLRRSLILPLLATALFLAVNITSGMMGLLIARVEFIGIELSAFLMILALTALARFVVYQERQGQGVVVSREAVYSSVALVLVGGYFILIGGVVKLLVTLGGSPQIFLSVLAAFVLIVLFVALAMSGSIRQRWRSMIDRSVYAGKADLLAEITGFAEDVTASTDRHEMFAAIAHVLENRCGMRDVTIYLKDKGPGGVSLRYPETALEPVQVPELEQWLFRGGQTRSFDEFRKQDLQMAEEELQFVNANSGSEVIPLIARKEFVGFIACRSNEGVSEETRFLIDSISHQLALSLLSVRQSEALLETRELANFTKVSSFVIHDVKNLISMLSMIIQNAERKFDDPRFQKMTTDTLKGAQERMQRLIGRLSSPGKQLDFALCNCDLNEILLSLAEEMKLSAQHKVEVVFATGEIPPVKGNAEKLRSVLSNLIINAIEAMPTGGTLRFSAQVEDSSCTLIVEDSGVGMTTEFMRERLFRPFQTSKQSGLGIGLFQSRELVEQMGGSLSVQSTIGKGSSFKLKLKRA